jgi:hypothetical protein
MLMVFIFGAAPSSFTEPVTSPAVAASTIFPAGALAAGAGASADSSFFPPQPVIAMANMPAASEYIPSLLVFTKKFLLLLNDVRLQKSPGVIAPLILHFNGPAKKAEVTFTSPP